MRMRKWPEALYLPKSLQILSMKAGIWRVSCLGIGRGHTCMKLLMTVRHARGGLPEVSGGTLSSVQRQDRVRCLIVQTKGAAIRWRLFVFAILYRMTS